MGELKSRQDYARYRSETAAVWKQVFLETHREDEKAMKTELGRLERMKSVLPQLEAGVAEMCIDHDVPWETVEQRAQQRNVGQDTLDSLYGIVRESAYEQAKDAGYEGMTTGMRRYITDEQFNEVYDRSMAD